MAYLFLCGGILLPLELKGNKVPLFMRGRGERGCSYIFFKINAVVATIFGNLIRFVATMAKTDPIGVRFKKELLEDVKTKFGVDSPQKALVFYERVYVQFHGKISSIDALRESATPQKPVENQFMGHPIPEGLAGIQLAVWKNDIKTKQLQANGKKLKNI